ncbi:Bbp16 family capsid cement protein, partial [Streptococcus pyogenes]
QAISSPNANLSGATVLAQTGAIPVADLPAGRRAIVLLVPRHALTAQLFGQRYLGLQYTVNSGPLTAGAFTANVVHDVQDIARP